MHNKKLIKKSKGANDNSRHFKLQSNILKMNIPEKKSIRAYYFSRV